MNKALKVTGIVLKVLFFGVFLIGHFVMNCVGVLVHAITE